MGVAALLASLALGRAASAQVPAPEPSVAAPDDPSTRIAARELGKEAIALYRHGRYADALDRITRAHALVKLTTTGLWRARCLQKLGRFVEAAEQLREVTQTDLGPDPLPVHVKAKQTAQQQHAALVARIPKLTVRIEGEVPEDTTVYVDGKALPVDRIGQPVPLDPGTHDIAVKGGGLSADKRVALSEGQVLTLPLRLEERDTARGPTGAGVDSGFSPAGIVGFVAIGVGAAGLAVGSIFGAMALGTRDDLDDNCPQTACLPAFHGDVDAFDTQRTVSTVSFAIGGVLAGAGLILVITDVATTSTGEQALFIGPHGLSGRF